MVTLNPLNKFTRHSISCHFFSMYILLRGRVTIYIQYTKKIEDDDKNAAEIKDKPAANQFKPDPESSESIRQQLGTFVTHLGKIVLRIL